jgi:Uma2 family endonuclease
MTTATEVVPGAESMISILPGSTLPDPPRELVPGSSGWSASDLDDPRVERQWLHGRYEIIEGVLSVMAAAYFPGGESLDNLVFLVREHLKANGSRGGFGHEVDIVVDDARVVRADAVYLDPEAKRRQREAAATAGRRDPRRTRILVPPTLVIESVSPGHELHDRRTKRRWYAEFSVPNYWVLDTFGRSLECLVLEGGTYRTDAAGKDRDAVRPSMLPGLVIPLQDVWEDEGGEPGPS